MRKSHQSKKPSNEKRPWNIGRLLGQKPPLKRKDIWAIRVWLQLEGLKRDLALFNLAIDSKLRGCDLVAVKVTDVWIGDGIATRAMVVQKKTGRPVQFKITEITRDAIKAWLKVMRHWDGGYLFPSRMRSNEHLSTRQYSRLVKAWVKAIGLDPQIYGTHSMRRTKATLIYRRTHNLRAVQLLLGHTKLESTVRYLGIDVDDALEIAEETEI
ncbi:MAG: tyrosine-type recombinase/integrase [Pseudomonadota bacterium]